MIYHIISIGIAIFISLMLNYVMLEKAFKPFKPMISRAQSIISKMKVQPDQDMNEKAQQIIQKVQEHQINQNPTMQLVSGFAEALGFELTPEILSMVMPYVQKFLGGSPAEAKSGLSLSAGGRRERSKLRVS